MVGKDLGEVARDDGLAGFLGETAEVHHAAHVDRGDEVEVGAKAFGRRDELPERALEAVPRRLRESPPHAADVVRDRVGQSEDADLVEEREAPLVGRDPLHQEVAGVGDERPLHLVHLEVEGEVGVAASRRDCRRARPK